MKNIIIGSLALFAITGFIACKKPNEGGTTKTVKVHYPTILIDGSDYYSIAVGGALPTIKATAYDSVTKEVCATTLDASGLDNTAPGLNTVAIKSSNSDGYVSYRNVYVAVTNVDPAWDLTGAYARTSNGFVCNVEKVANGLYRVDNVGGAPTFPVVAFFCQFNDSTINLPLQPTIEAGDLDCTGEKLMIDAGDTSYSWVVKNAFFGPAVRTFVKQ